MQAANQLENPTKVALVSCAGGSETFASANESSSEKEQVASTTAEESGDNNSDKLLTNRFLEAATMKSSDNIQLGEQILTTTQSKAVDENRDSCDQQEPKDYTFKSDKVS